MGVRKQIGCHLLVALFGKLQSRWGESKILSVLAHRIHRRLFMVFDKRNNVAPFSRAGRANVSDPGTSTLAAEGLELMRTFVQLSSADDRLKVIAFAKQVLRNTAD